MFKRHFYPFILFLSVILVITGAVVFYSLPKYKLSSLNISMNQPTSSSETLAFPSYPPPETPSISSSPPQTTTLPPSSILEPIHVSDSKALDCYEQGLELYYQRQFFEALNFFNQALAIDPLCYEALNAKGATLAFQGNYDQGLALIQQALDLNPSFVYGNFNRGLANELAGRWDTAITAYQKTLQLDNRDTWSYYGIASIYGRLGKIDKVLEYLQPAIALDPDVKEVARDEHDFAPVRQDPRFQTLVKP